MKPLDSVLLQGTLNPKSAQDFVSSSIYLLTSMMQILNDTNPDSILILSSESDFINLVVIGSGSDP